MKGTDLVLFRTLCVCERTVDGLPSRVTVIVRTFLPPAHTVARERGRVEGRTHSVTRATTGPGPGKEEGNGNGSEGGETSEGPRQTQHRPTRGTGKESSRLASRQSVPHLSTLGRLFRSPCASPVEVMFDRH